MTINEYISRLDAALSQSYVSPEEKENVLQYYTEILEDSDDPEQQMANFGTPEQLAESIRRENGWGFGMNGANAANGYPQYEMPQNIPSKKSGDAAAGRIIALIFTSPLWIAVYVILAVLLIVLWTAYACLPFSAAVCAVPGASLARVYVPYAVEFFAASLICAGLTILLLRPCVLATKGVAALFAKFSGFLFGVKKTQKPESRREKTSASKAAIFTGTGLAAAGLVCAIAVVIMHPTSEEFAEKLDLDDESYELSADIVNLDVSVLSPGRISILPSADGKARLEVKDADLDKLTVSDGEDCGISYKAKDLSDTFWENVTFANIHYPSTEFTLYLPEKAYSDICVKASCGDLRFNGISADRLDLDSDVGKISVKSCTLGRIKIEASLGAVNISDTDVAGDGNAVRADCGDISVENVKCTDLTVTESLGKITISGGSFDSLSAENDCGDVDIKNVDVKGALRTDLSLGAADISGVTAASILAELDCGDYDFEGTVSGGEDSVITLSLGEADIRLRGNDYTVRADTDMGEVKVNGRSASMSDLNGGTVIRVHNDMGDIDITTD